MSSVLLYQNWMFQYELVDFNVHTHRHRKKYNVCVCVG